MVAWIEVDTQVLKKLAPEEGAVRWKGSKLVLDRMEKGVK
jgi:hypothetical protein